MNHGSSLYLGIDVGTGSARAGLFDRRGLMVGMGTHPIRIWRESDEVVEQSSDDIWRACCEAVRSAMNAAGIRGDRVCGVGFDATCSLVVLGDDHSPVSVSESGEDARNVIVWMDHRAMAEAERINSIGHDVLKYVGGRISPEMQTPKLLWLKERLPRCWRRAKSFFDLPDYLTFRATGEGIRSLCSTVCKWTYLGHETCEGNHGSVGRWDDSYFCAIGLGDLVKEEYARIGKTVRPMGEPVGNGLTDSAAQELRLRAGTPVGVSIIDAHAGGVGMLGAPISVDNDNANANAETTKIAFGRRLALVGGTSTCHMAVSDEARFIGGVWGPYFSAMIPGMWLSEGGQSATGSLIDHVIFSHARRDDLRRKAELGATSVYEILNRRLHELSNGLRFPAEAVREVHVLPYFHGNRSPRADAKLRGMVSGLTLSDSADSLAILYLATVQAVAQGTRHIIETMNAAGYHIDTLFACGGGTKNRVFLREHADVTGCRIVLSHEPEAVLLGSAILGAVASGAFDSVTGAMSGMSQAGEIIEPTKTREVRTFHDAKYSVFLRMYEDQVAYRNLTSRQCGE